MEEMSVGPRPQLRLITEPVSLKDQEETAIRSTMRPAEGRVREEGGNVQDQCDGPHRAQRTGHQPFAFYMDVLGLEPERLDQFRRGEVSFPSVRVSADIVIDLFPMRPGEALGDGPGLQNLNHFTMVVEAADFEGFQKRLVAHGVTIEEGPARRWGARGYGQSVYFRDPDGNRIEVRCYPSNA